MRISTRALTGVLILAGAPMLTGQTGPRAARTTIKPVQQQTPFTAEFKIVTVKTLANGTTITHESTETRALDSQGRQMNAITRTDSDGESSTSTWVFDPVAGATIVWDSKSRQVTVTPTRPSPAARNCVAAEPKKIPREALKRTSTQQDLGDETILGIDAHGVKTTITVPTGAIGNSEPLVSTHEEWHAVAIKPILLVVRQVDDDPQAGHSTRDLTNLSQSEPDAAVFQAPQGYEVVNRDAPLAPCPAGQAPVAASVQ